MSKVSHIQPFTITGNESVPTTFSNLILTVGRSDMADWNAWRDAFVVNGVNGDANEKSGSLESFGIIELQIFAEDRLRAFFIGFDEMNRVCICAWPDGATGSGPTTPESR